MDGLARIELARLEQPRHVAIELVHARKEIDHDETLHPDPRADRPREIAQFGRPRVVVDVDHTAQGKARAFIRRSEEHTSELQSLMRISYAVFCLKKKKRQYTIPHNNS